MSSSHPFLKHIAVPRGARVSDTFDQVCTENTPEIILNLGSWLKAILARSPLPDQPTEQDQRTFLEAYFPLLQKWMNTNFAALQQIGPSVLGYPVVGEPYHRNLLLIEPGQFSIYIHVWGPHGKTQPHTHGKQIGLILPLDGGMQEHTLAVSGEPWQDGLDRYVRLQPAGSPTPMPTGELQVLTRDTRYLHVVENTGNAFSRVMEIYISPLKRIRFFEAKETPDIYRELIIRKTYIGCVSRS